jgi:hypothetical protein
VSRPRITNRPLGRVLAAFLLFVLAEYSVWIAMLVYAYERGGARTAGIVAVAQLLPGVVVGPLLSTVADRRSPATVLVGGYLVQALGAGVTAVTMYADGPALAAYAGAIVAATAVTATRPAQATAIPSLARTASELSGANAMQGWLDNVAAMAGSALTGLALGHGQPGLVFAAGALATLVAAALTLGVQVSPLAATDDNEDDGPGALRAVLDGLAALREQPQARVLVGLSTAMFVVVGALDVLFVVLAISVLHEGEAWTGYLGTAEGLGGIVAGAITVGLVGRRLGGPLVAASGLLAVALGATAFSHTTYGTAGLLCAAGLGRAVLDTATRTLLQRSVRSDVVGRIFGVVEGLSMAGLAAGSLLVPVLIGLGGTRAALLGTAAVVPLALLLGSRTLGSLDRGASVPVVEIALLRSMPHFRALPAPELEGLARAVKPVSFAAGATLIRQGEAGDLFYAIVDGEAEVFVDGVSVAVRARPEGLGEIALLRQVPRTATVIARTALDVLALDGNEFVTVVTGHPSARRQAEAVASGRLASDPTS